MRLEIDARARNLLRLVPLTRLYSSLELALMGVLAWQAAQFGWALVTPVNPVGAWRLPAPGMGSAARETLRSFDPFFRLDAGTPTAQTNVVTSLQLTLFGTRMDSATGRGGAIIAGPDGEQKSYAVGDEVAPGATLSKVAFDNVTIVRGGREETLYIDQSGAAAPASGGAVGAPPAAGEADTAPAGRGTQPNQAGISLAQLRSEVGFIPRIDAGRVSGLVVRPQGSGATFRKIGLKEGDIVTQIGGRPVTGPADIEALSTQFARGGNISITVERGADVLPLVITVSGQ